MADHRTGDGGCCREVDGAPLGVRVTQPRVGAGGRRRNCRPGRGRLRWERGGRRSGRNRRRLRAAGAAGAGAVEREGRGGCGGLRRTDPGQPERIESAGFHVAGAVGDDAGATGHAGAVPGVGCSCPAPMSRRRRGWRRAAGRTGSATRPTSVRHHPGRPFGIAGLRDPHAARGVVRARSQRPCGGLAVVGRESVGAEDARVGGGGRRGARQSGCGQRCGRADPDECRGAPRERLDSLGQLSSLKENSLPTVGLPVLAALVSIPGMVCFRSPPASAAPRRYGDFCCRRWGKPASSPRSSSSPTWRSS